MCYCDRLPELFEVPEPYNWNALQNKAYRFFLKDVIHRYITFQGKRAYGSSCPTEGCHRCRFEHIISMDDTGTGDRNPDTERLRRITWIRPLIELNCTCSDYKVFPDSGGSRMRWRIWCSRVNYIIVLEDRGAYFRLITAYNVIYRNKRKSLEQEYNEYIEDNSIN